ncbi:MAG: hypothetical protein NPIRA02_37270 [Nitrospirales bacterium]|nr:MAG: hypothetical protein NPIRA02_37270 [Nitrospirales bacterium]
MRFIGNGPNIPDELLIAQDEGNVVFFCGAGVSMADASLPSFSGLAQKVMNDLGATEDSKAKQQLSAFNQINENSQTRGLISADHIFSSLGRSFDLKAINRSVAKSLNPKANPNLSAHKTILKLARLRGGQTRLITTNFDLLFESCNKKLKSCTRSILPRIEFSDNNWGIVHLHGKVKPDYSSPADDGFVLSSSEFGDAYLAQGWARDFVKDVLEKFVAVFIGYSADDPPVRYLLEGLQQSKGSNHKIYAFQSGPDDESVVQWDEKGVEAIVYDCSGQSHQQLWNTLEAWADRSNDPIAWKRKVLSKSRKNPSKLQPHERGMVAHLIKSQTGARAFEQMNPPMSSEWLCVLDPRIRLRQSERETYPYPGGELINPYQLYALDDDPPPSDRNKEYNRQIESEAWDAFALSPDDYEELGDHHLPSVRGCRASDPSSLPSRLAHLASWIGKVSEQRIAVWWAGQQFCLHPHILSNVKTKVAHAGEKPIPAPVKKAWDTIFELSYFYGRKEDQEYDLKILIKESGWSNRIIREYEKFSAPFLKRGTLYTRSVPRDNRKKITEHSLARIEVDYPTGIYDIEIPDEFLVPVLSSLRANLERAIDLNREYSGWLDLCAIELDESTEGQEYSRVYGLSGYVLHFVGLFRRLVDLDKEEARSEHKKWRKTDPIFTRLRIWASGVQAVATEEEFADEIVSLKDTDFWSSKGERDLLLSLKKRWGELSPTNRDLIEKKILKGPPK